MLEYTSSNSVGVADHIRTLYRTSFRVLLLTFTCTLIWIIKFVTDKASLDS